MWELTTNEKGAAAEAVIQAEAIKLGLDVYRPMSSHARSDLLFGMGTAIWRVQVKCGRLGRNGEVVVIHTNGSISPQPVTHIRRTPTAKSTCSQRGSENLIGVFFFHLLYSSASTRCSFASCPHVTISGRVFTSLRSTSFKGL